MNIKNFYKNNEIDEDFDENFYLKSYYWSLVDFLKDDGFNFTSLRKKLFYHYKTIGIHQCFVKNYNYYYFNKKKSTRKNVKNKLAVITAFFNPCNYSNLKNNYDIFEKNIKNFCDLFVIELSFNDNFYIKNKNSIKIKGNKKNILWQKERMLNILLEKIPEEYTDIAWIDCDIIFQDKDWVEKIYESLNENKIIQLFKKCYRFQGDNKKIEDTYDSIIKNCMYGSSGFAWAARRETLDQIKFLDNRILGGGDSVMSSSFINSPYLFKICNRIHTLNDVSKSWVNKSKELIDSAVDCINCEIDHLYHGSFNNRNYKDRYSILLSFNKSEFYIDKNNLWATDNIELTNKIYKYFLSRKEDDNLNIKNL